MIIVSKKIGGNYLATLVDYCNPFHLLSSFFFKEQGSQMYAIKLEHEMQIYHTYICEPRYT